MLTVLTKKRCTKCGVVKGLEEFYCRAKSTGRWMSICKVCWRENVQVNRKAKWKQYAAYDRERKRRQRQGRME